MRNRIIAPPYMGLSDIPTVNSLFSQECLGDDFLAQATSFSVSGAWIANLLTFIPLILKEPFLLSQFYWMNGNANNGNVDVGIYSEDGQTKIISTGSTLASGTSAIQLVDVTDTWLPANRRLWLALGGDGTNRFISTTLNAAQGLDYLGVKQQISGWSSGLPATIAPATPATSVTPLFGFTRGVI